MVYALLYCIKFFTLCPTFLSSLYLSIVLQLVQRQQDLQDEQRRLTAELSRVEEDEQEHRNRVVMIEPQLKQINGVYWPKWLWAQELLSTLQKYLMARAT